MAGRASRLAEVLSDASGRTAGGGVERGVAGSSGPAEPPAWTRPGQAWEATADRLRERLLRRLPVAGSEIAVQISSADVETDRRTRRIAFTRVLLGRDARLPAWSRTFLGAAEDDEPTWLEPLARELSSRGLPWRAAVPPGTRVYLDAFAAADLVRATALGWLRAGVQAGERVLPEGFDLDDPGSPFGEPTGVAVDDEGTPERPLAVVRDGRLFDLPRGLEDARAGRGRSTGSAVTGSWRTPPATAWRSLALRAHRTESPQGGVPLITRAILLPGQAVLFGYLPEVGRFGPWPAGAAEDLLARACAACGPAIADAVGVPLFVPPLLIDLAGWRSTAAPW